MLQKNAIYKYYIIPTEAPYFGVNAETEKVFFEFDEFEEILCSAYGYPPPDLYWDVLTYNYIEESGERLFLNLTTSKDLNGNWTIALMLTFKRVLKTDEREFICHSQNIVDSFAQSYTVTVLTDGSPTGRANLLIGGSFALGLLGLIAIPVTYLMYRMKRKVCNFYNSTIPILPFVHSMATVNV